MANVNAFYGMKNKCMHLKNYVMCLNMQKIYKHLYLHFLVCSHKK